MIDWQWKKFSELDTAELYAILQLRQEVFVVEQLCPYQDLDGVDQHCHHLLGWETPTLLAYLRVLPPDLKYKEPSIGRVLCAKKIRGQGLGKELMQMALAHTRSLYPEHAIKISAQQHLENFYQDLGFATTSEPYLDVGIKHIDMKTEN